MKSTVDLDLTSDDPREFVRELVKLKLALLDGQLAEEARAAGAESEEAQRLQATRRAFAALGRQYAAAAEKPAPRDPVPAPMRPAVATVRGAEPAIPRPDAPASSPESSPGSDRRPRRVVISDENEAAPARRAAVARAAAVTIVEDGKSAPPAPVLATIQKLKAKTGEGTLSVESVEQIEKMAQEEGFLDTQEMLWLKRGRLRDQIVRLEAADAEAKQLIHLRKELQSIEYLLAGGLQEAKLLGQQQAAAKQQQVRQQKVVQQEKLKVELTGLLDEIDNQGS